MKQMEVAITLFDAVCVVTTSHYTAVPVKGCFNLITSGNYKMLIIWSLIRSHMVELM